MKASCEPTSLCSAICWHSLMFVNISLSEEAAHRVRKVNREYANSRPDAQLALLD